jgi:hypothetical protein
VFYGNYLNMTDSLIENHKKSRGGKREGSGRPLGSIEAKKASQIAAKERFLSRVHVNADKLFNAQLDKAVGEKYLMVKKTSGTGKDRKSWTEIVTDPELIKQFLDEELDDTDQEFYYMTTKPADNQAIQGLLDRGFGKAQEKVDITSNEETIVATPDSALAVGFTEYLKSR